MELKQVSGPRVQYLLVAYNRTNVELKRGNVLTVSGGDGLIIEPMWN